MNSNEFNDPLHLYYNRELDYLREIGASFSEKYPKIANRLRLYPDSSADPHVERLIESFAFLTARVQYNIDHELNRVPTALLNILYPYLMNISPAMIISKFIMDPKQGKMTTGFDLEKGTLLTASAKNGKNCRFSTCYKTTLWPLECSEIEFVTPQKFDFLDDYFDVASVLRLRIESSGGPISDLELNELRFHVNGTPVNVNHLYEMIFCNLKYVMFKGDLHEKPISLKPHSVLPVGFKDSENIFPRGGIDYPEYRILKEFFSYPTKFHFFDLIQLELEKTDKYFDVFFLFDTKPSRFMKITKKFIQLNCVPAVNLFRKISDPLKLNHKKREYAIYSDLYDLQSTEIYSIEKVSSVSDMTRENSIYQPFFSYTHELSNNRQEKFWYSRKQTSNRRDIPGTLTSVSFVDINFNPAIADTSTVYARLLCTNRMLTDELPSRAELELDISIPAKNVFCLTKPTFPLYPSYEENNLWKLISHLSLNHLSLSDDKTSLKALKEILNLYSHANMVSSNQQISGIVDLKTKKVVRRIGRDAWRGFLQGREITLTVDEDLYVGNSEFLFASVLNRFFGLYSSVNSFTRLILKSKQRKEIWKKWNPRSGAKELL